MGSEVEGGVIELLCRVFEALCLCGLTEVEGRGRELEWRPVADLVQELSDPHPLRITSWQPTQLLAYTLELPFERIDGDRVDTLSDHPADETDSEESDSCPASAVHVPVVVLDIQEDRPPGE